MIWIPLALASYFFWALVNIGDKYVVSNRIKNPYVYMMWLALLGIVSIVLIPFIDFFIPPLSIMLWLLAATSLYFYGGLPYIRAVQLEDISRVNIWWNLIPLFSLVLAWQFLGEQLAGQQIIAFVLLVAGAVIASIHLKTRQLVFSKALWYMVAATLAFAGYAVILRLIAQVIPFIVAFVWTSILAFFPALTLLFFSKLRKDFFKEFKSLTAQTAAPVLGVAIFDNAGLFFNIWALSLGPVALVYALEGFQTVFVFMLAILISVFNPKILREETDVANVLLKLTALVLMIIGASLIHLN